MSVYLTKVLSWSTLFVLLGHFSFASAQTIAIMDGEVHTITQGVIENGDVIIEDGVITQIGADLSAPEGARVINAVGRKVTPGLFTPISNLSQLGGIEVDYVGANFDIVDAFEPNAFGIAHARTYGVTNAGVSPRESEGMFSGSIAVYDFIDNVEQPIRSNVALVAYFSSEWQAVEDTFEQLMRYSASPEAYAENYKDGEIKPREARALEPVLRGDIPLVVYVFNATSIKRVLRLKEEYQLNIILAGANEGWKVADEIAQADVAVLINPKENLPRGFKTSGSTLRNPSILNAAGVEMSFLTSSGGENTVRQAAGVAVSNGLPYAEGLAAITINPAQMYGVDDQIGSLEIGKAGNVVIWEGDPLDVTGWPVNVFINGEEQSMNSRHNMLYERYKDLSRKSLPTAYQGK